MNSYEGLPPIEISEKFSSRKLEVCLLTENGVGHPVLLTLTDLLTIVTKFSFYEDSGDHAIEYVTYFGYKSVRNAS